MVAQLLKKFHAFRRIYTSKRARRYSEETAVECIPRQQNPDHTTKPYWFRIHLRLNLSCDLFLSGSHLNLQFLNSVVCQQFLSAFIVTIFRLKFVCFISHAATWSPTYSPFLSRRAEGRGSPEQSYRYSRSPTRWTICPSQVLSQSHSEQLITF